MLAARALRAVEPALGKARAKRNVLARAAKMTDAARLTQTLRASVRMAARVGRPARRR